MRCDKISGTDEISNSLIDGMQCIHSWLGDIHDGSDRSPFWRSGFCPVSSRFLTSKCMNSVIIFIEIYVMIVTFLPVFLHRALLSTPATYHSPIGNLIPDVSRNLPQSRSWNMFHSRQSEKPCCQGFPATFWGTGRRFRHRTLIIGP